MNNKFLLFIIYYLALSLLLSFLTFIRAQEKTSSPEKEKPPKEKPREKELDAYIGPYKKIEIWKEDDIQITAVTEATVYLPNRVIRADTIIGWSKVKEKPREKGEPVFDEIYAEGNVEVVQGKDIIRAEQVYYDIKNGIGIIKNVELRTVYTDEYGNIPVGTITLVVRAPEVYQINPTTLMARNASVTSCPHGKPHYEFFAKKIKFIRDEKGKRVILTHIIPHIAGVPFFYWPYFYKVIGSDSFIRSLKMGKSSRFGRTYRAKYGLTLFRYKRDKEGCLLRDKEGYYIKKHWGDFTIQNDFYQKRGLGWKPKLTYHSPTYKGRFHGYYIRDKGPDSDIDYEQQFLPLEKERRSRFNAFHRQILPGNWRFDSEVSWLSDRNFLLEFFETEYKEEKEQESYGYLRWAQNEKAITCLGRLRSYDFQPYLDFKNTPYLEYLPQITFQLIKYPQTFWSTKIPFYFTSVNELANMRQRYDESLNKPEPRIWRYDSLNEVSMPYYLGLFNISPFLALRFTGYEKNLLEDKYIDRLTGSGGIRLFSQFHRTFQTKSDQLGIKQLRHTISFDLRYANTNTLTTEPSELLQYDTIDGLNKFEEYYLEIRNQFQTRTENEFREFLTMGLAVEYYPEAKRDTTSQNPSNVLYPMNWISLAPDSQGYYERRGLSNLNLDLTFKPKQIFSIRLNTEYNTYDHKTEVFNASFNLAPFLGWNISLSEHYVENVSNALGLAFTCRPIEKWQIGIADQYDFQQDQFINRIYSFRRDLHELFLEFSIYVDKGKDEKTFYITLTPKGLFQRPFKPFR